MTKKRIAKMDRRIDLMQILEDEGKMTKILLYPATEIIDDPYEKTKSMSFLNPLTIKAYVTEISFSSLRWKYTGQIPSGSVQILCDTKYAGLLKLADRIKIGDDFYKTWKDDAKNFMILKRDDHLVVILGKSND
jgi:hypothetical protein